MVIFLAVVMDEIVTWVSSAHPPVDSAVVLITAQLRDAAPAVLNKFSQLPGAQDPAAGSMVIKFIDRSEKMKHHMSSIDCFLIATGSLEQDILRDWCLLTRSHTPHWLITDEAQTQGRAEDI